MVYFIAYSWNILFIGWLGDQLIHHGYKIGDAIYLNNWYELRQLKIRQIFSIIICRTRRPIKITAGKYFALSLKTIGQVKPQTRIHNNILKNKFSIIINKINK